MPPEVPQIPQDSGAVAPPMPSPMEAPTTPFGAGNEVTPVDPNAPMPGAEVTPEQKQQLMDMINAIREKLAETNANMFAGQNKSEQSRIDALKELFEMLQSAGVDLQDPNAVQAFIDQMRQFNPDVAQMFEDALQSLLGGDEEQPAEDPAMGGAMGGATPPEMPDPNMTDVTGNVEALPENV